MNFTFDRPVLRRGMAPRARIRQFRRFLWLGRGRVRRRARRSCRRLWCPTPQGEGAPPIVVVRFDSQGLGHVQTKCFTVGLRPARNAALAPPGLAESASGERRRPPGTARSPTSRRAHVASAAAPQSPFPCGPSCQPLACSRRRWSRRRSLEVSQPSTRVYLWCVWVVRHDAKHHRRQVIILHTKSRRECDALPQKTTGPVGHSSVRTRWPYVVVVVVVKYSEAK